MGREVGERARIGASAASSSEDADVGSVPGRSTLSSQLEPTPIGELSAQRVGQVPDEDDAGPEVAVRNTEGSKQEIAATGAQLPPEGGAEELQGGVTPEAGAAAASDGPVSPEVSASIVGAQNDTRDAIADAEAESAAYKADMKAQRDRFDAEQNATMLEQVKTMSSADKRSTLVEMGYDAKAVKKMKDAELASVIEGRISTENRKTRILGMDPEERAALSPGAKIQYLVDLGIDRGDLDKAGEAKATRLFDDVMKVANVPGEHKVKIQIKGGLLGKSWEVSVKCDAEGNTDIQAKKEGGFLSKLWGWVKAALPIILTVLGPLTLGASLIALSVYQTVVAIKTGDWLGAVVGAAGALVGVSAFMVAKGAIGASSTFAKMAQVAGKVKTVAQNAEAAMTAVKARSAGSLLGALASGAASFAKFASATAEKFKATMTKWSEKLKKWGAIISGGEKVAKGVKTGDPIAAIGGAFDTAAAAVNPTSGTAKQLQRGSALGGYANAGRRALSSNPPNYGAVADAAFGIATLLTDDRRVEDAARITAQANRLKTAWDQRESHPAALAEAALGLAGAIQVANYDLDHDEVKGADGKAAPDATREAITTRYQHATKIVHAAGAALTAATAKPRPNYVTALSAATELIAELTADKRIDAAAVVTSRLDAWTQAVASKDERAILAAGQAFGEAIHEMRTTIESERDKAKTEAAAALGAGEILGDDGGTLPAGPGPVDLTQLPGTVVPAPVAPAVEPMPRFEETITVRAEPGAPETPRFETSVTVGPAPGPQAPNTSGSTPGPAPKTPPRLISEEAQSLINVVKGLAGAAKDSGVSSALGQGLKSFEAAVDVIEKFRSGDATEQAYQTALATLKAAKEGLTFKQLFLNEWNRYASALSGTKVSKETIQAFGKTARALGRVARFASIPDSIDQVAEDIIVACGYNKDLSGAQVGLKEQAIAAGNLANDIHGLAKDLGWAKNIGTLLSQKLAANTAVAAINMVRYKVNTFGDDVARVVMEHIGPPLEKIAAKLGAPEALKAAQRIVTALAEWGPTYKAVTSSIGFQSVARTLGGRLVTVLRFTIGWEVTIAYEVAKLEAQFADKLYKEALAGTSQFFSAALFGGKPIQAVKAEVRNFRKTTNADCDQFFKYAFHTFIQGAPGRVLGLWLPHARRQLKGHLGPSFDHEIDKAPDPTPVLQELDPSGLKQLAAGYIEAAAMSFLDAEFQKEFHHPPE